MAIPPTNSHPNDRALDELPNGHENDTYPTRIQLNYTPASDPGALALSSSLPPVLGRRNSFAIGDRLSQRTIVLRSHTLSPLAFSPDRELVYNSLPAADLNALLPTLPSFTISAGQITYAPFTTSSTPGNSPRSNGRGNGNRPAQNGNRDIETPNGPVPILLRRASAPSGLIQLATQPGELPTYRLTPFDQLPPPARSTLSTPPRAASLPLPTSLRGRSPGSYRSSPTRRSPNLATMLEASEEVAVASDDAGALSHNDLASSSSPSSLGDVAPVLGSQAAHTPPSPTRRDSTSFTVPRQLGVVSAPESSSSTTSRMGPPSIPHSQVRRSSIDILRNRTRARRSLSNEPDSPLRQAVAAGQHRSWAPVISDTATQDETAQTSPLQSSGPLISIIEPSPIQHINTFTRLLSIENPRASRPLAQNEELPASDYTTTVDSGTSSATAVSRASSADIDIAQRVSLQMATLVPIPPSASPTVLFSSPGFSSDSSTPSSPASYTSRISSAHSTAQRDKENVEPEKRSREHSGESDTSTSSLAGASVLRAVIGRRTSYEPHAEEKEAAQGPSRGLSVSVDSLGDAAVLVDSSDVLNASAAEWTIIPKHGQEPESHSDFAASTSTSGRARERSGGSTSVKL